MYTPTYSIMYYHFLYHDKGRFSHQSHHLWLSQQLCILVIMWRVYMKVCAPHLPLICTPHNPPLPLPLPPLPPSPLSLRYCNSSNCSC